MVCVWSLVTSTNSNSLFLLKRVITIPMKGLKRRLKMKLQPKPIFLFLPSTPTRMQMITSTNKKKTDSAIFH